MTQGSGPSGDSARKMSGARPPLDLASLEALRALERAGSPGLVAHVAKLFNEECATKLVALVRALTVDNREAVRDLSHSLKSSAANLGAHELARQLGALERRSRAESRPFNEADVSLIIVEARRVQTALADLLK